MRNDYSYTATGAGRLGPIFAVFVPDKQLRGIKKEAAALFFCFTLKQTRPYQFPRVFQ